MKPKLSVLNKFRIARVFPDGSQEIGDDRNGAFRIDSSTVRGSQLLIIMSDGGGWDHVSVSTPTRCPTWEEMDYVKNLFFAPDETVVQFHPPKNQKINVHNFCLHLWRPQGEKIVLPPAEFV